MTTPRARNNSGSDTTSLAVAGTGLLVSSRLSFMTRRIPERKSAPYWEPVCTGFGAYAEVFRILEHVHHDSDVLIRTPLSRTLVAKVFRDCAPSDYEFVYASELRTLLTLGHHERIVGLRGAADSMPPNFVCGHIECGQAFQIDRCPQCNQHLRNGDSNDTLLICGSGHRYQKYNAEHLRILTHHRPCQHQDDCTPINFMFRPYILLEELTCDLRILNDRLTEPPLKSSTTSPIDFSFESKPDTDERRREVLLLRLDTLIGVAEGLAFLHGQGCLHADIAPENAMVRLSPRAQGHSVLPEEPQTKLIDFGLAKRVEDNRTTTTVVGRITFLAPEQMVAQGSLGPKVAIRFRNGQPQEGEVCRLVTVNGDDLPFQRRDFLRDVEDGQYEVLTDSEVSNDVFAHFGDVAPQDNKPERGRAIYARVLKPPLTGCDATQTTLRFSFALDLPTDIFSLGCLIAWSVTGGQEDIVHLLREQASVASRRSEVISHGFGAAMLGDDLRKFVNAIDLPRTADDDELRAEILDLICRALVRSDGAYCRKRSSGYSQPAVALAADLRKVRNILFLMFHTHEVFAQKNRHRATSEADRVNKLSANVEELSGELDRKTALLASRDKAVVHWRGLSVIALGACSCLSLILLSLTRSESDTSPLAAITPEQRTPDDRMDVASRTGESPSVNSRSQTQGLETPRDSPETPPPPDVAPSATETELSTIVETKSLPPPSGRRLPRERSNTIAPPKQISSKDSPKNPLSMKDIAERGNALIQSSCKISAASLKDEGRITVRLSIDTTNGKVSQVTFMGTSAGLSLAEANCVKSLAALDFSDATDLKGSLESVYPISLPSTKGNP